MEMPDIEAMFSSLGPVTIKRMFGGNGVYYQGRIIAVEFQGDILLKADEMTASAFEAAGAIRWSYQNAAGCGWQLTQRPRQMARIARLGLRD